MRLRTSRSRRKKLDEVHVIVDVAVVLEIQLQVHGFALDVQPFQAAPDAKFFVTHTPDKAFAFVDALAVVAQLGIRHVGSVGGPSVGGAGGEHDRYGGNAVNALRPRTLLVGQQVVGDSDVQHLRVGLMPD